MCIKLQENKINKMNFYEAIDQFIEQFKGQFKHKNYVHGGHDLKTTKYGGHFTFCNPELTLETCACLFYANRWNEARKFNIY